MFAGTRRNTKKNSLSPEVNDMLKGMMKSSKLSNGQQRFLDNIITSGKTASLPLSQPMRYTPTTRKSGESAVSRVHSRPNRRTLDSMIAQDAFKQEPYRPPPIRKSRSSVIERAQDAMSGAVGKSLLHHSTHKPAITDVQDDEVISYDIDEMTMRKTSKAL